jgi:hypothetical protein
MLGAAFPNYSMERIKAAVNEPATVPLMLQKIPTEAKVGEMMANRLMELKSDKIPGIKGNELDKSLQDTVTVIDQFKTALEKATNALAGNASSDVLNVLDIIGGVTGGVGVIKGAGYLGKKIFASGAVEAAKTVATGLGKGDIAQKVPGAIDDAALIAERNAAKPSFWKNFVGGPKMTLDSILLFPKAVEQILRHPVGGVEGGEIQASNILNKNAIPGSDQFAVNLILDPYVLGKVWVDLKNHEATTSRG